MSTPVRLITDPRLVKRNSAPALFQARIRDRMLRAAFLNIAGALRARPADVRVTIDNAARKDNPSSPWQPVQGVLRSVAQAAANESLLVQTETRSRIRAYLAAVEADALSFLPAESDESVVAAALAETEAEGATNVAQMAFTATPNCPIKAQTFVERAQVEMQKLVALIRTAQRVALHTQPARQWK